MKCNKCNSELTEGSKYCSHCGSFNEGFVNETSVNSNTQVSNNVVSNLDERMIKAYIGKDSDKIYSEIMGNKPNIFAILFGVFYYAYRKMYLVALLAYLASVTISNMLDVNALITSLAIGLLFGPLYKWDINRKITNIKFDNKNSSEAELIELASKKGGTSVAAVIISAVILFMIVTMLVVVTIAGALLA